MTAWSCKKNFGSIINTSSSVWLGKYARKCFLGQQNSVFFELFSRKTVCFSAKERRQDKLPCIFFLILRQMDTGGCAHLAFVLYFQYRLGAAQVSDQLLRLIKQSNARNCVLQERKQYSQVSSSKADTPGTKHVFSGRCVRWTTKHFVAHNSQSFKGRFLQFNYLFRRDKNNHIIYRAEKLRIRNAP